MNIDEQPLRPFLLIVVTVATSAVRRRFAPALIAVCPYCQLVIAKMHLGRNSSHLPLALKSILVVIPPICSYRKVPLGRDLAYSSLITIIRLGPIPI